MKSVNLIMSTFVIVLLALVIGIGVKVTHKYNTAFTTSLVYVK